MIRTFALLSLVLAACVAQPAQSTTPAAVIVSDDGQPSVNGAYPGEDGEDSTALDAGDLAAGATVECIGGHSCNWDCPAGGCDITCAGGSNCNVDCAGGGCNLECSGGAVCNFDCQGGGCNHECADGSTCNVDD